MREKVRRSGEQQCSCDIERTGHPTGVYPTRAFHYEVEHMDFTDAYLVAFAESGGLTQVASFDKGIDKAVVRASVVRRLDPLRDSSR